MKEKSARPTCVSELIGTIYGEILGNVASIYDVPAPARAQAWIEVLRHLDEGAATEAASPRRRNPWAFTIQYFAGVAHEVARGHQRRTPRPDEADARALVEFVELIVRIHVEEGLGYEEDRRDWQALGEMNGSACAGRQVRQLRRYRRNGLGVHSSLTAQEWRDYGKRRAVISIGDAEELCAPEGRAEPWKALGEVWENRLLRSLAERLRTKRQRHNALLYIETLKKYPSGVKGREVAEELGWKPSYLSRLRRNLEEAATRDAAA